MHLLFLNVIEPIGYITQGSIHLSVTTKEVTPIPSSFRELRNSENKLLCTANDRTGQIKTEGPHKSVYMFEIPIGGSFTVDRGTVQSVVTRTEKQFVVKNRKLVA